MEQITIEYDGALQGFIIRFPDWVTLAALKDWGARFDRDLTALKSSGQYVVLIATGKHAFESVACLRYMREYLSTSHTIRKWIRKAAFIAPKKYMPPHVKNCSEAYFNEYSDGYTWLMEDSQ